jgi:hypothetical protein
MKFEGKTVQHWKMQRIWQCFSSVVTKIILRTVWQKRKFY